MNAWTLFETDKQTRLFTRQPVRVGIVADTYDNREGLRQLLDRFLVGGAQWLIHCGGLGASDMIDLLKPWQVFIVAGEKERNREAIEKALQKTRLQATLPATLITTIEGFRVGVCRGDDMSIVNRWAKSGEFDFIFYGYALRRSDSAIGRTRVINPGALSGPRYQARSGCLIDLTSGKTQIIEVPG